VKVLPNTDLKLSLLEALAELEDNECHRTWTFPKTRLHKLEGTGRVKVYRADIDKVSGWRLHLQYGKDKAIHLKDIVEGQKHDRVIERIVAKRDRYE
jgi:hypothetical protein